MPVVGGDDADAPLDVKEGHPAPAGVAAAAGADPRHYFGFASDKALHSEHRRMAQDVLKQLGIAKQSLTSFVTQELRWKVEKSGM